MMKPDEKGGCTADVCDCMRGSQIQKMVFVFNRARHAHKTDPVLSAAVFAVLAKAARATPEPTDQSPVGIASNSRQIVRIQVN